MDHLTGVRSWVLTAMSCIVIVMAFTLLMAVTDSILLKEDDYGARYSMLLPCQLSDALGSVRQFETPIVLAGTVMQIFGVYIKGLDRLCWMDVVCCFIWFLNMVIRFRITSQFVNCSSLSLRFVLSLSALILSINYILPISCLWKKKPQVPGQKVQSVRSLPNTSQTNVNRMSERFCYQLVTSDGQSLEANGGQNEQILRERTIGKTRKGVNAKPDVKQFASDLQRLNLGSTSQTKSTYGPFGKFSVPVVENVANTPISVADSDSRSTSEESCAPGTLVPSPSRPLLSPPKFVYNSPAAASTNVTRRPPLSHHSTPES